MNRPMTDIPSREQELQGTDERKSEWFVMLAGLLQWKKFILYFTLLSTVISVVVSFLLPRWYKSTASLLPPKDVGFMGGIGNISTLLKDFAPVGSNRMLGQSSTLDYLAILSSRRAKEAVVNKFDLIHEYGISDSSMEKTIKQFDENYNVEIGENGTITIDVFDRDRFRAAEMTAYVVQVLNEVSTELNTGEARNNREFLEKRIEDTRGILTSAENTLKSYEEKNGVIVLSEDAKSSVSSISQLYARKAQLDVELAILSKTTSPDHPEYQKLQLERTELEKKLSSFPELGMEAYRLYREVMIQQKVLEVLVPLFEQARIEEKKNMPVMNVLDKPVPAERKARPQRLLIVASTFLSSFIISVLVALIVLRFQLTRSSHSRQYLELRNLLRWKKNA